MPEPSQSAGGRPDDWNNDGKDGCKNLFLFMIITGTAGLILAVLGLVQVIT